MMCVDYNTYGVLDCCRWADIPMPHAQRFNAGISRRNGDTGTKTGAMSSASERKIE